MPPKMSDLLVGDRGEMVGKIEDLCKVSIVVADEGTFDERGNRPLVITGMRDAVKLAQKRVLCMVGAPTSAVATSASKK